MLFRPGRQKRHQRPQKEQWQNGEHNRDEQSLAGDQSHLVGGVSQETLGKQLAADHDVPAHGKNADHGEASGQGVNAFAGDLAEPQHLGQGEKGNGSNRAEQYLDHDMRNVQFGMDHEMTHRTRRCGGSGRAFRG